jgi:hypothetical protein
VEGNKLASSLESSLESKLAKSVVRASVEKVVVGAADVASWASFPSLSAEHPHKRTTMTPYSRGWRSNIEGKGSW